jgi:hypothetical protein
MDAHHQSRKFPTDEAACDGGAVREPSKNLALLLLIRHVWARIFGV